MKISAPEPNLRFYSIMTFFMGVIFGLGPAWLFLAFAIEFWWLFIPACLLVWVVVPTIATVGMNLVRKLLGKPPEPLFPNQTKSQILFGKVHNLAFIAGIAAGGAFFLGYQIFTKETL